MGAISELRLQHELAAPTVVAADYDFERARSLTSQPAGPKTGFEIFEYPAGFRADSEGQKLATRHHEARAFRQLIMSGQSSCLRFAAGCTFELSNHLRDDANQRYLLLSVRHIVRAAPDDAGGAPYENRFVCIPARVPLRPRPRSRRPSVYGPQTAVVVGDPGKEIHTDQFGRVALRFHWDREQQMSCWARVAQSWAGKGWGSMFIPRVGQEVVVEFLNGDPEQPLVTGALYNGAETVPYALPEHAYRSGIKTNTLHGKGYNELRFDDKQGEEQVFLRAERELHLRAGGECREWIGKDRHLRVGGRRNEEVGENFTLKVGQDLVVDAESGLTLLCAGNYLRIDAQGVTINGQKVFINCAAGAAAGRIEQSPAEAEPGDEPGAPNSDPRQEERP